MYRICAAAALLLLVAPLCAADATKPDDSPSIPWYRRVFFGEKPAPKRPPAPAINYTRREVATSLEQEQRAYVERLKFCTRLRQIATETSDEELLGKADELEQQASDVYLKKTSKLPTLVENIKAAESALDQRGHSAASGTASAGRTFNGRAPNGKPITTQE